MKEVRGMTNSQVKKAIDETIGTKPLMNEAFVKKVMNGKNKRKNPVPFFQPALVVVLMLLIGAVLYFTPQESQQSAVEIQDTNLTDLQLKNLHHYYTAIVNADRKSLKEISLLDEGEEVFERYEGFDFSKRIEVVKVIETTQQSQYFVALHSAEHMYLDHLAFDKESEKFLLNHGHEISYYEREVEFPKTITVQYKQAPVAKSIDISNIDLKKARSERINGNTFYQLETKRGMRRIFETFAGEYYDLGIASEGISYYSVGHDNQFYFIDALTKMLTFIYLNDDGDYQILTGELEERGITNYQTDVHEEAILLTVGEQPKVMSIQNGKLVYADLLEHAEFENPKAFYSIESIGPHVLVKYTEDLQQISTYYKFTTAEVLTDYRTIDVLEAKPEHLQDMSLANRYNDQTIYIFSYGKLHSREKISGELVEKTFTNIKVETKGNQYFITGDDGFSWTLTRTAPRILQDEKGIEYTVPIAFEELKEMRQDVLEDDIRSLRLYEQGGSGMNAYVLEEDLPRVNELFTEATPNKELVTLENTDLKIEIEYNNGKKVTFDLWLREGDQSIIRNPYPLDDMYSMFRIPNALADEFRQLLQRLEEIDSK